MSNPGFIEVSSGSVSARVYYDTTAPVGDSQPLINGPRGYCLDVSNPTGAKATVSVAGISATVAAGDPVTSGSAKSQTAAQVARLGYTTRGQITAAME
jgi:hypothetical protein